MNLFFSTDLVGRGADSPSLQSPIVPVRLSIKGTSSAPPPHIPTLIIIISRSSSSRSDS